MRRRSLSVLLGILAVAAPLFSKAERIRDPGSFSGRIVDEITLTPLIAVNVMVENTPFGAASDMNGQFEIEDLPAGTYNVRFSMIGYETRAVNTVVIRPDGMTWQQIELKPSVLKGEEVMVSAGYFHEARDGVVSNRSMDAEEVRSDPGSMQDMQRVVQVLPSVVSGTDQMNEIIVRGGMPGENLFVMDDIEISNPNHFANQGMGGGPINMLNAHFVRRIDFFAGAFPARYGDKASSVMDISLREGNRQRMSGHSDLGMAGAGLMVEGPLNQGRGSFLLSARKSYLDLIKSAVGLTAVPQYHSLQGKGVYDLTPSDQLIINGVAGQDYIEITPETEEEYDEDKEYVESGGHQIIVGSTWRHLLGNYGYTKVTASEVRHHWDVGVEDTLHAPVYENYSTEIERTLRFELTWLPEVHWEFNVGGQMKNIDYDIHEWVRPDTIFTYSMADGVPVKESVFRAYDAFQADHAVVTSKNALFAHAKWKPHSKFQITLGLRRDLFNLIGHSAYDPRFGLSFQLSKQTRFNAALGQHSQAPNYFEIAADSRNIHLNYKKTRQVVLGIDHLFAEDMRGVVEAYYKDYRDIPMLRSSMTLDPYDVQDDEMVNAGKGFSRGIEMFLQKKLTRQYHFTISYAYSTARGYDPRHDQYYNWDYDYRHIFSLMGGTRLRLVDKAWYQNWSQKTSFKILAWLLPIGDEMDISLRWRYLGGRPYTRPDYIESQRIWVNTEATRLNAHRFPAYHRLDLRIGSRFMFKNFNVVTFFDMVNVYNRDNVWDYVYQSDGTVDRVEQFSMVPVGGVVVEF